MSAEEVIREIEHSSRTRYLPIIGREKGACLEETVVKYGVRRALELGMCIGYSAIRIARNLPPDGRLVTVEIDPGLARIADDNIRRAELADKVEVVVGDAARVLPKLDGEFDMIFLDTAHSELLQLLKEGERLLKKGSVVFTDNVKLFARSMRDFLDYVRNSGRYESRYVDFGHDGVEISVRLS